MHGFSRIECRECGWRHELAAFKVGQRVLVVDGNYCGQTGTVIAWSQYGGPVYVRVAFGHGSATSPMAIRENFSPCQLEHE